ncbi:MAG TPA: type II secretion system F family protein, partial [Candidatus Omnitrophica bacterium]|nr:type II secretion system F family protein [Candidatus Omnitrophota bacterium]
SEFSRLSRTLGTLIKSGVPITAALNVLAKTSENEIIRKHLNRARKDVIDGAALSASLKKSAFFPPMMTNIIGIGEESGSLENSLFKIAGSYDKEVDRMVKTFTTLLEPMLILVMGAEVGFIVIAMLLPIFQINIMVG